MALPSYSPSHRVTARDGKQDKIDLTLSGWAIVAAQVSDVLQGLANFTFGPNEVKLYNRPTGGVRPTSISLSKGGSGRHRPVGAPLFSGKLTFRTPYSDGPATSYVTLYGTINPTRFVAHQPAHRRGIALSPAQWLEVPASMETRALPRKVGGEAILTDNDNVLLGEAALRFARAEVWPVHFDRYWRGTIDLLSRSLASATPLSRYEGHSPTYKLDRVETYWEMGSDDPTALVAELEPVLFQLGIEANTRFFPPSDARPTREASHNARQVTVRLRNGVWLKCYAKTTKRVRFEIVHDVKLNRTLLNGGRNSTHLEDLWGWLEMLRSAAADDLNSVLEVIERRTIAPADSAPTYALIRRVMSATRDDQEADALLSLIVHQRVVRLGVSDPLRVPVMALMAQGVLKRSASRRGGFYVDPTFSRAASELAVIRRVVRRRRPTSEPT